MAKNVLELIQQKVRGRVVLNAPMKDLTTLKVGGPADIVIYPADREDLVTLLGLLEERSIPRLVVGLGSNLLVRDGGIRGAVISLADGFKALERRGEGGRFLVRAEAGLSVRRLVRWSVDEGISGFEALAGIPGCVGGAVAMNAGAWGFEIGERVRELEVMDGRGTVHVLGRDRLQFSYRRLELPPDAIVLSVLLEGAAAARNEVKARVQEYMERRREKQPLQDASAGSIFKNPEGESAGRLIDQCGLKGVRVGDAEVSRIHANFIVNAGMATASQVVALMGMIQERVYVKYKVRLEPEVVVVGDWDKGKLRIQE